MRTAGGGLRKSVSEGNSFNTIFDDYTMSIGKINNEYKNSGKTDSKCNKLQDKSKNPEKVVWLK